MYKMILALPLFIGLVGSLFSMLEWGFYRLGALFDVPFGFSGLIDGFLLVFNRLFEISEQRQLFRYVMFYVNSPEGEWEGRIAAALLTISVLFAVLAFFLARVGNKFAVIVVLLAVVFVQVYFGVVPSAGWNIILFASLALMLAQRHDVNIRATVFGNTAVILMLLFISAIIWVTYPDRNLWLHEFSESIRDRFDTRINPFAVAPFGTQGFGFVYETENLDFNIVDTREDTLHESPHDIFAAMYDERAYGAEIGLAGPQASLLPAVFIVAAFAVAAFIVRFVPPYLKALKRRKMFSVDDSPIAINNMFIYMLEWLAVYGLERRNVVFSAYASELSGIVSREYSEEYAGMTALWQKAVYSGHAAGEDERRRMMGFLDKTMSIVWKNSGVFTKIKIKLQYFL